LTALAQQQPGLPFGTGSGVGSSQAMVALWYAKLAGVTLKQVPYRGGAPAINDLIAGHVKLGALGSTPLVPHYQAGAAARRRFSPSMADAKRSSPVGISVSHRHRGSGRSSRRCCQRADPPDMESV
jgi:hypothetical protein